MQIRQPAVAGRFYPNSEKEIRNQLDQVLQKEGPLINKSLGTKKIFGAVVPHAGYMYSAYQAMHFFEILKNSKQKFDTFVIINPNHSGYGPEVALDENDYWATPFGNVELDRDFHDFLDFNESSDAHQYEHSGEVMLPMLQYSLDYPFKIVPISILRQNPENAVLIAHSLFRANTLLKKNICIIASSDFSHFVSPDKGKELDTLVIDQILDLNSEGMFKQIRSNNISVCGYCPIMSLIEYTKLKSANPKTEILKIGHSGEVIPSDDVVDYVSILFYE